MSRTRAIWQNVHLFSKRKRTPISIVDKWRKNELICQTEISDDGKIASCRSESNGKFLHELSRFIFNIAWFLLSSLCLKICLGQIQPCFIHPKKKKIPTFADESFISSHIHSTGCETMEIIFSFFSISLLISEKRFPYSLSCLFKLFCS